MDFITFIAGVKQDHFTASDICLGKKYIKLSDRNFFFVNNIYQSRLWLN